MECHGNAARAWTYFALDRACWEGDWVTVLLLAPEPGNIPAQALVLLRDHFQRRWPGTFFLGLMPGLPRGLEADEQFDWMTWPLLPGDDPDDNSALLEKIMRRFEAQAVIGLGCSSSSLLSKMGGGLSLCFDPSEPKPKTKMVSFLNFYQGHEAEALDSIDDWLVHRVAVDLIVSSGCSCESVLDRLKNHAGSNRARLLRVRWLGRVDLQTVELMESLCSRDLVKGTKIELELLSSELFQLQRSGSTHSPMDFLASPDAWYQIAVFASVLLKIHPRVKIRVRTVSSKDWIRKSVDLANTATGAIRNALGMMGRIRR